MEQDNVRYLPTPEKLSPEQTEHWERALEKAERAREYALRMLGRIGVELGLEDGEV